MSTNKKTLIDGDFQVGSSHLIVDTENNYVGFNNATPQNKIDVQIGTRTGTHSTGKPLYVTGVTNTSGAEFVSDDGTAGIGIGSSNIFATETNQNITIAPDGTGAVGIKTATPNPSGETFDLWVQGDTKITGNVTVNEIFGDGSGLFNVAGTQWVSSSEDIYFLNNTGSGEGKVGIGKTVPEYKLDILDSDKPTIRVKSTSTGDGDALLILDSSATGESDIDFKHDGVLNWRIRTGDASASGTTFQLNNANDSDVLTIQQNGNVGIGTNSPNVPLEVNKSAGGEMFRLATSTGTLYAGVDANPPWFGTSSDDHLRLVTNGTEKIRIESGGNVGIGKTDPGSALDVNGTVTATTFSGALSNNLSPGSYLTGNAYNGSTARTFAVDATTTSTASKVVARDASKNVFVNNLYVGDSTTLGITKYIGEFGSVSTLGEGTNSYAGYAIRDDWVFMSNGASLAGIYDDTNNKWATRYNALGSVQLYHAGNLKLETTSTGVTVTGTFSGALSGNASTATTLQTARTIGGVSFNGSANITPTTFGGATFSGDVAFDTNTLFVDVSANRVGIGTTAPASPLHVSASTTSTHTMKISHSDTDANTGTYALLIDADYSGADTYTGDKTNAGIYIDLDSSATGGDTTNEHRIYGVYSDVRHSGDSNFCYSGYFLAQSDHTSGQCSALKGVLAYAVDSANGTNSNVTAGEFIALKDSGSTNTTATMMGVRGEVEIDAGIVTNAYAVHGHIDRDGGTITNGYLFHGSYAGSDTGVKWGLYLSGDEINHVDGSFGIGTDAPGAKLDVNGDINSSGKINIGTFAVGEGYMASKTLTLGDISSDYGGGNNWTANTAALMFECANNTEMAVHDSGTRVASLMHYEGSPHRITIGRDMGWGTIASVRMYGSQSYPNRPVAMVGKNNGRVYSPNVVVYNIVLYNDGGLYNTSNGRFTAPAGYAGYYLVTYTGLAGERETGPNTRWQLNGNDLFWGAAHVNVGSGVNMNTVNGRLGMNNQLIYYLNAGDYLTHRVIGGSIYGSDSTHSTTVVMFMGSR